MLKVLRDLLASIVDKIDSGNCNMSDEQLEKAIEALRPYALYNPYTTSYKACTYLGVCPKTFRTLIEKGEIPEGIKEAGDSSLKWLKTDIENYSKKSGKKNKLGFTLD